MRLENSLKPHHRARDMAREFHPGPEAQVSHALSYERAPARPRCPTFRQAGSMAP